MGEQTYNLKPLQKELFRIYKEIEKICERHGLRVYATSGTALGAVRHHGFIPWDDDLDVGMPREDCDLFYEIAEKELPPWLRILNWRNSQSYNNLFGKVIVCDHELVDRVGRESNMRLPQGLYVDVFPFDGFPVSRIKLWWRMARRAYLNVIRYPLRTSFSQARGLFNKARWIVLKLCGMFCGFPRSIKRIWELHEVVLREMPFKTSERVASCMWYKEDPRFGRTPREGWFNAGDMGAGTAVPFEDSTIRIFDNCKPYLISLFGDYMQLPPESQRQPSHSQDREPVAIWRFGPEST